MNEIVLTDLMDVPVGKELEKAPTGISRFDLDGSVDGRGGHYQDHDGDQQERHSDRDETGDQAQADACPLVGLHRRARGHRRFLRRSYRGLRRPARSRLEFGMSMEGGRDVRLHFGGGRLNPLKRGRTGGRRAHGRRFLDLWTGGPGSTPLGGARGNGRPW